MRSDKKIALNMAVLTVSDTRTLAEDSSGSYLCESLKTEGHELVAREILKDDVYQIRALVSAWIADPKVQVILTTGGTGVTGRDVIPESLSVLFDKEIPGYGEIFRYLSLADVGTSTIQSRCIAGVANGTLIFTLPGSTGACRLGWEKIIGPQLDATTGPCNFANLMGRLHER
jgi:molybdenum cofactor biosynthesis protein B